MAWICEVAQKLKVFWFFSSEKNMLAATVDTSPAAHLQTPRRCCSSVVEHSLGKGEVESSIPSSSTRIEWRRRTPETWRLRKPNDHVQSFLSAGAGRHHTGRVNFDRQPLLCVQHNKRDAPTGQVLLILQILIGRDHDIESGDLCGVEEFAVQQRRPAHLVGSLHIVSREQRAQADRNVLVKEDERQEPSWRTRSRGGQARPAGPDRSRRRSARR